MNAVHCHFHFVRGDVPSLSGGCVAAVAGDSSFAGAAEFKLAGVAVAAFGTVSAQFAISPPGFELSPYHLSFKVVAEHHRSL